MLGEGDVGVEAGVVGAGDGGVGLGLEVGEGEGGDVDEGEGGEGPVAVLVGRELVMYAGIGFHWVDERLKSGKDGSNGGR